MLADISEYFEDEIDGRLTVLTSVIEPVILICMGLFIGTIVITMYLPIFKLAGAAG
jgi:type IV pilus assembly protein PilC